MQRTASARAHALFSWTHMLAAGVVGAAAAPAALGGPPAAPAEMRVAEGGGVLELDAATVRDARSGTAFRIEDVEVPGWGRVDLELERFRVASERTRFVAGTAEGDREIAFDPESVVLLRGRAVGLAGSHVVMALTAAGTTGRLELGPGRPTMALASAPGVDTPGVQRVEMRPWVAGPAAVLACGFDGDGLAAGVAGSDAREAGSGMAEPIRGLKRIRVAVDSDREYFELMGSERAAVEYIVTVYGLVSDIMMRDISARIDLTWVRVWPGPDPDPYRGVGGFPRIPPGVEYDQAQNFAAERESFAGGMAFVCARSSWIGHVLGFYGDPVETHVDNRDIIVAAHEMGHSLGTLHTHDYGVDECDDPRTNPTRNSIMSYCYYFNGGYANTDLRFHTVPQGRIAACHSYHRLAFDCNQNGLPDVDDIASGFSADVNGNGIPDECEDCNGNGVLDDADIASGFSRDLNENEIPDECEPDCNGNGSPDEMDIRLEVSLDENGNGVPDECEADLDGNGRSDYLQIQADMTLDINRNTVLDAYEDCDGDGGPDLVALDGAWSGWVMDGSDGALREFHPVTGVLMRESATGIVGEPQDLIITPDRRILVSDAAADRIVEFDTTAAYVRDLVAPGAGGLSDPGGMLLRGGTLLVASAGTDSVLRFDVETGAPLGALVAPGAGGLTEPYGMTFGPDGSLYVTSADNQVMRYSASGAFERIFVSAADNGGLTSPRDILFTPAMSPPLPTPPAPARFLVASELTSEILEFDPDTGAFRQVFNIGTQDGKLERAWGMEIGRDGEIYLGSRPFLESAGSGGGPRGAPTAQSSGRWYGGGGLLSHATDPRIFQYQTRTGLLLRPYIQNLDSHLPDPVGFAFIPGDETDCNFNQVPDNCDIASGFSEDSNGNGVPDECESCIADCDGTGALDFLDFLCFQSLFAAADPAADCDGSGGLDFFDFLCFQNAYAAGCP